MSGMGLGLSPTSPVPFRATEAISHAFSVFFQHSLAFLSISALIALPNLLYFYLLGTPVPGNSPLVLLQTLLSRTLSALCEAVVVFATFQHLRGRPVRVGESFVRGFSRFFPTLGTAVLVGILVFVGVLLLIIPGIIVSTMLAVAIPACVVERLGPFKSLKRSRELTDGYKGGIFLAFLAIGLASWLLSFLIGSLFVRSASATAIALYVWGVLLNAFTSVVSAIIYHDLRVAKEGIDIEQIASVFD